MNLISGIWITYLRRPFWRFRFDSVPVYHISTRKKIISMWTLGLGPEFFLFYLILSPGVDACQIVPFVCLPCWKVIIEEKVDTTTSARSKKKETGQKRTIFQAVRSFRYSDDILKIGFVPSNWLVHSSTEFVYSPYLKSISLWRKRNNRKWQVVVLVTRVTQYALFSRNQVELADSWRVNLK